MSIGSTPAPDLHRRVAAHPEVAALDCAAARIATPCGTGATPWRHWGAGPPPVLLHGAHGSWTRWLRSLVPLAGRFSVLVLALPGMGDSDMPADPPAIDGVAKTVARGLAMVTDRAGPVRLVGLSCGATVAASMIGVRGRRISHLVLAGATPGGPVNPVPDRMIPRRDAPDLARRRVLHCDKLGG